MLVTQRALHASSDLWAIFFATEILDIYSKDRNPGSTLISTVTSRLIYHKNPVRLIGETLYLLVTSSFPRELCTV